MFAEEDGAGALDEIYNELLRRFVTPVQFLIEPSLLSSPSVNHSGRKFEIENDTRDFHLLVPVPAAVDFFDSWVQHFKRFVVDNDFTDLSERINRVR